MAVKVLNRQITGLCKWADEVWGFIIPDNLLVIVCELFKIISTLCN